MATLTTCTVCKKQHSDDVKRCPHCGAIYSKPITQRPFAIFMIVATGYIVYSCTMAFDEASTRIAASEAAKTPEQKASEKLAADRQATLEDAYLGCQVAAERKAVFKNPKSIEWDSTQMRGSLDKKLVGGTVRATNSFGAVVAQAVTCTFEITNGTSTRITAVQFNK